MKELTNQCLHHIAGGAKGRTVNLNVNLNNSDGYCCSICVEAGWIDDLYDYEEVFKPASISATGVLSGLGSRLGFPGFVTGAAVGYLIDSTDFNALGENYKRDIMSEIQKGNTPTD